MPPTDIFFTSYARRDNKDSKLSEVVEKLRKRIGEKLGEDVTIFFDTKELTNGEDWQKELGKTLKETRLIVCLFSPSYLKSPFCAKEFEVFRRRIKESGKSIVAIIPVVWEPVKPLPQAIGDYHQPADPRYPSDYYAAGLWKLAALKSQEDNLTTAVDELANDIVNARKGPKLPAWKQDVKYRELPDSLHHPTADRYGIALSVLSKEGSQWKPGDVVTPVGTLTDEVAFQLKISWEDLPVEAATLDQQLARADKDRLAIIVVVEADAQPPWSQVLDQLDKSGFTNFAVLVGMRDIENSAATDLRDTVQKLLPVSSAAGAFHDYFALDDEEAFRKALTKTATALRLDMINHDEAKKVTAPGIRASAVSDGVPVDSLSSLTGPGSKS